MQKPKLFEDKRDFLLTLGILLALLLVHLLFRYDAYKAFISKPFYFTHANVLSAYIKHKHHTSYQVLKLESDEGLQFYTTTHRKRNLSHTRLRLQIFPDARISFWGYLGRFYVKSRIKEVEALPRSVKDEVAAKIALQHDTPMLQRFYSAIFLATPLSKEDREIMSALGISHLVALSGFHLGILWGVLYGVLWLLYRPLQQRWFPYRYALIDMGVVAIALLGLYVWFVGMPPSLVRAYAMVFFGWLMLVMAVELISFGFLTVVLAGLLVLFPSLLVSLGFWFSVAGVFYIFLLLHYTQRWNKSLVMFVVIPLGIFLLMLPLVHIVFETTTKCQLLSPLLSLLFTPFYPLLLGLHLLGMGGVFDGWLEALFTMPCKEIAWQTPLWLAILYGVVSLAAIRYRMAFVLLLLIALGVGAVLYI